MPLYLLLFIFTLPALSMADDVDLIFASNVIRVSRQTVGLKNLPRIDGKYFRNDCIGYVRYVYYKAGVDLDKVTRSGNNGVANLYLGLDALRFTFKASSARPGDIIFFDNTYDINRNGKWDDPLSHIGVITAVGRHNTLTFVHYASGVVKESVINLDYPETHAFRRKEGGLLVINSYLRRDRGEGFAAKEYVASSFYRCFARINVRARP